EAHPIEHTEFEVIAVDASASEVVPHPQERHDLVSCETHLRQQGDPKHRPLTDAIERQLWILCHPLAKEGSAHDSSLPSLRGVDGSGSSFEGMSSLVEGATRGSSGQIGSVRNVTHSRRAARYNRRPPRAMSVSSVANETSAET